ncbi:glycosyltransferase [Micromonospora sp. NBC_01699]|uniref:glycosyltransferase n=1 Tax=Micromonospora sp. NBC_01699 TaxID=2975984 RepID=UPI002E33CA69|nr:glycosyltransferase [Micromonospora sp. NBC_01699]
MADRTEPDWVLMFSGSPWRVAAHRQHALARQLAVDFRVIFVDPPDNHPCPRPTVRRVGDSLWHAVGPSPLPYGRQFPPVNLLTRRLTAAWLRSWLDRHPGARLLWLDEDLAAPVAGRLGESAVVYDATDLDWTFTRRWNRWHLRRGLRAAVGAADLVLASSSALPERLPAARRPPVVLPNGCDPDRFTPDGPSASWLDPLPRPRLGYLGAVDTRAFDADLVAAVARSRPEWTFVLVGPATPAGRAPLAGLPNVRLHDAVPYAEAPAVLRGCDVGVIPYRVGGLIDYVHPKKCYEYLALGLPVVATPLPALRPLAGPVRLAGDAPAFVAEVEAALSDATHPEQVARRRATAVANSWSVRGDRLRELLAELPVRSRTAPAGVAGPAGRTERVPR